MRKLTELLSKPVISLYEGKTEGTIKNAIFDKNLKKIKWLILFNDKDMLEEKFLPAASIYTVGENAVTIKNNEPIIPNLTTVEEELKDNPINNLIYNIEGKLLGSVIDVELDEKHNLLFVILDTKQKLSLKQIAKIGQDMLIMQDENNPVKINSFKQKDFPKIKKNATNQKVKVMEVEKMTDQINEKEEVIDVTNNKSTLKVEHEPNVENIEDNLIDEIQTIEELNEILEQLGEELEQINKTVKKEYISKVEAEMLDEAIVEEKSRRQVEEKLTETEVDKEPKDNTDNIVNKDKKTSKAKNKIVETLNKLRKDKSKEKVEKEETVEEPKALKAKEYTFNNKTVRPTKVLTNNKFLINRVALKNIYTYNKELIIKKGTTINKAIVNKALLNGKLNELIKFSK